MDTDGSSLVIPTRRMRSGVAPVWGVLWGVLTMVGWGGMVSTAAVIPQSEAEAARHWAFRAVDRPVVPVVKGADRVRTPVDAFLLARLEADGLGYAPETDRRTWLRRVYVDLVGMPPTFEEVEAFEGDSSAGAYETVVDRLLRDARYGERWGRHWLDVARYADTKDLVLLYGRDALRPYAYTYRDYVIRAFNEDLPYTEFVRDQLAADLAGPGVPSWRLAGMGFLTLGRLFDNNPHDQIDDQIDTVSRGLLGLTVACARCHDHKYDRVSMEDYYGLYGVFASSERPTVLPLIEDPKEVPGGEAFEAKLARARAELEDHVGQQYEFLADRMRRRLAAYLVRAATTAPDLTETSQFALSLTPEDFRPSLVRKTRRFLERRVRPDDPVFGPWHDLMALPAEGFSAGASGVLNRWTTKARSGERVNGLILARLASDRLEGKAEVARVYGQTMVACYEARFERTCGPDAYLPTADERELLEIVLGTDGPVSFTSRETPEHMSRPEKDRYGGLVLNLDKVAAHASNAPPARAMVMVDLPEAYESRVFVRGSPARPGKPAPRGFLGLLSGGERKRFGAGSGRGELAAMITSKENPLAARVWMNRVWMHHFGEPLVASTSDFGARSEPPTHPELLDWLASEFMEGGWRLKRLQRVLVLSSAYRQASPGRGWEAGTTSGPTVDPDNRRWWHYPRRRLDLEVMRDALLQASGRLDPTLGGRPVDVAGDPLNRRRTVYGLVDRQNLPGFFRSFDFAVPDQCAERRPRTSVPQQALFALNSAFVQEQAAALVGRAKAEVTSGVEGGTGTGTEVGSGVGEMPAEQRRRIVETLFRRALGRRPAAGEVTRAERFLAGGASGATEATTGTFGSWEQLAQVLLVSNEAVFVD